MERLTGRELRKISDFLLALYQLRTHEGFTDHVIEAIPAMTDGEFTSYNECPHAGTPGLVKSDPAPHGPNPEHDANIICRYADQHPFLNHVQKTDQRRITRSRHRDGLEFDKRTRAVFEAIRPHLQQALRNALAVTQGQEHLAALDQAMATGHQAMLSVTGEGRILISTPTARRVLNEYGVHMKRGTDRLPSMLRVWLRKQVTQLAQSDDVGPAVHPLLIAGTSGTLRIRLVPRHSQYLLLLQEDRPQTTADQAQFGLSARETEILGWIVQGKTNPEIGQILGISPRTVQKHLERLYGHLGVENRHAAISLALSTTRFPQ